MVNLRVYFGRSKPIPTMADIPFVHGNVLGHVRTYIWHMYFRNLLKGMFVLALMALAPTGDVKIKGMKFIKPPTIEFIQPEEPTENPYQLKIYKERNQLIRGEWPRV